MDGVSHVHLIGIEGSGLSAIARLLLESGYTVSGSDRQPSLLSRGLAQAGARVYAGHKAEHVTGADLVIRSSAVMEDNVEVRAAVEAGVPVLKRSDFLGRLMSGKEGVAVAGTHGKTTTTAMIAWMLAAIGQAPSFIVGGLIKGLETNAHAGSGPAFVIEADEYDGMFLGLRPKIAVVTNVEHDHPDCYPTREDYRSAFLQFTRQVQPGGVLLGCGDDPGARDLLEGAARHGARTFSYGLGQQNDYQARGLELNREGGYTFEAMMPDGTTRLALIALQAPGEHNARNALAALAVAHRMGLPLAEAALALGNFKGVSRRFEVVGEAGGVAVIDDYAHHPSEIRATLAAARARYAGRKLWVVWQPHTFSRTRALFSEFAAAFEQADHVLVTEIYAARETVPEDGFSGRSMAQAVRHPDVRFIGELANAASLLLESLKPGDVLLVLSAGDADRISAQVATAMGKRSQQNARA